MQAEVVWNRVARSRRANESLVTLYFIVRKGWAGTRF